MSRLSDYKVALDVIEAYVTDMAETAGWLERNGQLVDPKTGISGEMLMEMRTALEEDLRDMALQLGMESARRKREREATAYLGGKR